MVTLREAVARFISFVRKDQRDREFDREIATHIDMATDDHVRQGLPPAEARRLALAKLGGIEPSKQLHRESRGLPSLDNFSQDVRYALRSLRRTPGFTFAATATLAIGIGATTAIFSTVNAALLRPLPYPRADELVDVHTRFIDGRVTTGLVSYAEVAALNNLPSLVSRAAGFNGLPFDATLIRDDGTTTNVLGTGVTEGFFELLDVPMVRGRAFTHEEHLPVGRNAPMFVVLSHRGWTRLFNADPDIVGKRVLIAEASDAATVIGIASRALDWPAGTDFWLNQRWNAQDASHVLNTIVRLRPGATLDQLRDASAGAMGELAKTIPNDVGRECLFRPLLSSVVGDLGAILLIVLGATALLLMLACVNVTNLLLARGLARTHEIAMRTALGASRARVIGQLLTQSMVLATIGSAAGLLVAYGGVRLLLVLGVSKLPRLASVPFDWRVLLFTLAILLISGLVMGIAPALRLSGTDLKSVLNASGRRTASVGTSRLMSSMIVAEVALAIALVAGAGWLIQSFARLRSTDPGFTADGRLVIDVRVARRFPELAAAQAWSDALLDRVRAIAGPSAVVGAATTFPLRPERDGTTNIELEGEAPDPSHVRSGHVRAASPGFFEAMGVRLIAGRHLSVDDRQGTQLVAVINRAFARRFFPDKDPVGAAIVHGFPDVNRKQPIRIVGVVDDIRYRSLTDEAEAAFYLPQAQLQFPFINQSVVVHAPGRNPETLASNMRAELGRFDSQIVATFTPAPQIVADTLGRQELGMTLMLIFGVTALLLAAVGLYGVLAYAAAQRRRELATRLALGASGRQVFWLMMTDGQRLMLAGLLLGLALAYGGGRVVASNVFAMRAADPVVLAGASAIVVIVTWIATVIPAIRASRQDPIRALRSD